MSEPYPIGCSHCDFHSGMRGGDRCGKCAGTGSVFWADGRTYPNTERGYRDAVRVIAAESVLPLPDSEEGGRQ